MITCHNWTITNRRQKDILISELSLYLRVIVGFPWIAAGPKHYFRIQDQYDLRCRNSIEIFQDFRCRCRRTAPPNRFSIKTWLLSFLSTETFFISLLLLKLNDRSDFVSQDVIKSRSQFTFPFYNSRLWSHLLIFCCPQKR